eukprot:2909395-Prorocentrum_lima.AAC.1
MPVRLQDSKLQGEPYPRTWSLAVEVGVRRGSCCCAHFPLRVRKYRGQFARRMRGHKPCNA